MDEIAGVLLRPKFGLANEVVYALTRELEEISVLVYPKAKLHGVSRDPKDHIILECAIKAGADYLVTGDEDLLTIGTYGSFKIVTVSTMLSLIQKSPS